MADDLDVVASIPRPRHGTVVLIEGRRHRLYKNTPDDTWIAVDEARWLQADARERQIAKLTQALA